MKRLLILAVLASALLSAAPTFALVTSSPVPAGGITREEMANLMTQRGWSAKLDKDSNGNEIVSSRIAGVKFDVTFYECTGDRCRDIQFVAGWSNAKIPLNKINEWNKTKRFLRADLESGDALWATMDARIARGTTGNVQEYLALWPTMLREFTSYMGV